ncbi:spore coat protein CotJB [Desertibacillus haloalkaliphilus]|uniref:spore coat protein CotJB n=1 Tax=Desertibacillus haloalkaliphilus TaxID=1328930 RepID=UPI001C26D488|nr:spore coat protein CotJB [Desertibacillus haloalkaliphilus]MBU8905393.1 spore coat protein CotJB [Desertibacillus haloalkaliphilus]
MAQKQLPQEFYQLLEELQAVDFALVDLTLYLDTHPTDAEAINQFNQLSYQSRTLRNKVEQIYGPLQQYGKSYSGYPWDWNDAPWPWQI